MESHITRVVLAEDHPRVRSGLRHILENTPDIVVVGEASNGVQALELVEELSPDILLLDMEMPKLTGIEVAEKLKEKEIPVRILVLSAHDDRHYIQGMLKIGASGYLIKEEVPEILVKAVRGVAHGERGWVSSRVAQKINEWNRSDEKQEITLTQREREILRLVEVKLTEKQIAEHLGVSVDTIEKHLKLLFTKFKVNSTIELGALAKKRGYI
jgi:DNA-binding NarL/FixJ family response regulator